MGIFDKKSKHVRELVKFTLTFDGKTPIAKRADYRRAYSSEYVNVIGMTEDFKFITEETKFISTHKSSPQVFFLIFQVLLPTLIRLTYLNKIILLEFLMSQGL